MQEDNSDTSYVSVSRPSSSWEKISLNLKLGLKCFKKFKRRSINLARVQKFYKKKKIKFKFLNSRILFCLLKTSICYVAHLLIYKFGCQVSSKLKSGQKMPITIYKQQIERTYHFAV